MHAPDGGSPRIPRTFGWGIGLAAATATISGVSVYLNAFAVKQVTDPVLFTALKNGVAVIVLFSLLMTNDRARAAVPRLRAGQWLGLATVGSLGGGLAFILFFEGLAASSAPTAAFIHSSLFVWVALLAVPFLHERVGRAQLAALGVLLASQLLISAPAGLDWGQGGILIAAATGLWAIEVIVVRRLLREMPSSVGAVGRMAIGLVVLVGYLALTGRPAAITTLSGTQWSWVMVSGVLLAGYVATWYAALRRAPATAVTCVLVAAAPITALLSALGEGQLPAAGPLAGYGLVLAGAIVMAWVTLRVPRPVAASVVDG